MKKIFIAFIASLFLPALLLAADDTTVNEDDMFSNQDTVIDSKKYDKKNIDEDQNKKRIGLSGELLSVNQYTWRSDPGSMPGMVKSQFDPYIIGTLFTDIRLPSDVKGFGSFDVVYDASINQTDMAVKELFVDFNIARTVYFRTGKQVLQWGRCFLWNPTDLINIQKQTFITRIEPRDGTYGLKVHVPFGTRVNIYGYANTYAIDDLTEIAGAGKFEFLLGRTEMAFSVWGRDKFRPVYGYDFSTRLLEVDIVGEVSLSRGSNTKKVKESDGLLTAENDTNAWITKACIDFGHAFDFNNQPNKIQFNLEFFYNGDGYKENIFKDKNNYSYDSPVSIKNGGSSASIPAGSKLYYLIGNNLYEANYYSPFYAALFTTVNKFFISDLSFKFNIISNLTQNSFILGTGLAYTTINDFKAGIEVYGFVGGKNTEYTLGGNSVEVLLTVGIVY